MTTMVVPDFPPEAALYSLVAVFGFYALLWVVGLVSRASALRAEARRSCPCPRCRVRRGEA